MRVVGVHSPRRSAEIRSSRSRILALKRVAQTPRSPGEWLSLPATEGRFNARASFSEKAFSSLRAAPVDGLHGVTMAEGWFPRGLLDL